MELQSNCKMFHVCAITSQELDLSPTTVVYQRAPCTELDDMEMHESEMERSSLRRNHIELSSCRPVPAHRSTDAGEDA